MLIIVFPVFPYISSKSILNVTAHCVSLGRVMCVAVRSVHEPETGSLLPNIVTLIPVRFSLPVNESVIVSHDLEYPLLLFEDVMLT